MKFLIKLILFCVFSLMLNASTPRDIIVKLNQHLQIGFHPESDGTQFIYKGSIRNLYEIIPTLPLVIIDMPFKDNENADFIFYDAPYFPIIVRGIIDATYKTSSIKKSSEKQLIILEPRKQRYYYLEKVDPERLLQIESALKLRDSKTASSITKRILRRNRRSIYIKGEMDLRKASDFEHRSYQTAQADLKITEPELDEIKMNYELYTGLQQTHFGPLGYREFFTLENYKELELIINRLPIKSLHQLIEYSPKAFFHILLNIRIYQDTLGIIKNDTIIKSYKDLNSILDAQLIFKAGKSQHKEMAFSEKISTRLINILRTYTKYSPLSARKNFFEKLLIAKSKSDQQLDYREKLFIQELKNAKCKKKWLF